MRYFKYAAFLACLLIILSMTAGCKPAGVDATGSAGTTGPGAGTPTPSSIVVTLVPTAIAQLASTTVTATVRDAFSNAVPNITVNFSVNNPAAGSFSSSSAVTNAAGVATVTFTANAVDLVVIITGTVTLTGGGTIVNTANLTIGSPPPPVPANITLTVTPLSVNILGQATVTVTAVDGTGAPAYNTNIDLAITLGATLGSFSSTPPAVTTLSLLTNSAGQVTATFYAGSSSGTVTIQATATGVTPNIVRSQTISITSLPASITVAPTANPLTTSGSTTVVATVTNALGNAVPDGTVVTFAITTLPAALGTMPSLATTVTDTSVTPNVSRATVTYTAGANPGTELITASVGTSPNVLTASTSINIAAAATASIEFVSATPQSIGIQSGGITPTSAVIFLIRDQNGLPKGSVQVDFTLFGPTGAALQTASASSASDGTVTTTLLAGPVAGPARVVATVHLSSPAISASSGNISIGGGMPSDTHFSVAVSKYNLEGFAYDNIQSTITAYLADRFGNYNVLTGTSVSFAAEAGAIDTSAVTDENGAASSVFRTQNPRPGDVLPIAGEPSYTYPPGGHTYNPRDGWMTILVSTTGEETFVDENANGIFDDTFWTDIGEPFIDANDNGQRDTGELFFDWPSYVTPEPGNGAEPNGLYDNFNNAWDAQIPIWRTVNLVFTGPPHIIDPTVYPAITTSRIECSDNTVCTGLFDPVDIPKGSTEEFTVYVSDINMNTLIGGTTIDVALFTGSKGTLITPTPITLPDKLSTGPSIFTLRLRNTITDATAQSGDFYVKIVWKGIEYRMYYPGSINLLP